MSDIMISDENISCKVSNFLKRFQAGILGNDLEQIIEQLDTVVAYYPLSIPSLIHEHLITLYRGEKIEQNHLFFISKAVLDMSARNLALVLSKSLMVLCSQYGDVELVEILIKTILTYRFSTFVNLENDGRDVRFQLDNYSFSLELDNIRIAYRLELLRLSLTKYTDILVNEGPPEPQEIQSVIQRLNMSLNALEKFDQLEIRRHKIFTPFFLIDRLIYSPQRASRLFGMNLNILEYEEKLYKEYLIPLFPYLTEDKIFFESRKLRLQNEGFGCFPPITIRIVIGEKEFEFGEYTRLIAPNETKEIYVQEPGIFSHFLRDQNPNIDVKIVFSFQKFGRSYECSLLSDTVGSWVDRLPTSNIDIVLSHEIPLDRLSAKDFERLCYWIVDEERNDKNQKRFKDVLWLGESGVGEQGRDLIATEAETNRSYVFQCKRVDKFTPGQLKEELEKFEKEVIRSPNIKPDIYVLFTSCSITPETKRQGDSLAQQIGMGIEYWPKSRVDKLVRIHEVVRNRFWQVIHQS